MAGKPHRVRTGTQPTLGPASVATNSLQPNPHNPRRLFDEAPLKTLEESIRKVGILVPLTVYRAKGSQKFTILDGQRRWICAQRANLSMVPINEVAEPSVVSNITTMFQIHKLRKDWELMPTALKLGVLMEELSEKRDKPLAELTYAGGYIGLRQAIELDSLRFAFDELRRRRLIGKEQFRWMLLALCKALSSVANTTGHFAQYLSVKRDTLGRFLAKRRRSVFREWLAAMANLAPAGQAQWRKENRTFRKEALVLLQQISRSPDRPTVIYADPPYTKDHYSRYYHLWETLLRYDYPEPAGKGQYRPDRFVSRFSVRSEVEQQFDILISRAAALGVELVLNYPENGLLDDPKKKLLSMLRGHFTHAEIAVAIPHQHSTLGASKGVEKEKVTELVFYAR